MTVKITRDELTASELRRAAAKSAEASVARRMLAIALVLDGHSRQEAAQQCRMDRQTLRDWIHRYNAEGLAGLSDRPHAGGPKPALSREQLEQVAEWVRAGPEPEKDGVIRWRRIDLRDKIAAAFAVRLHERSVGKQLRRLGFRRISVRPRHPRADAEAQKDWVFDSYDAIVDACCAAWNALMAPPSRLRSITERDWAKTVNAQGRWYNTNAKPFVWTKTAVHQKRLKPCFVDQ